MNKQSSGIICPSAWTYWTFTVVVQLSFIALGDDQSSDYGHDARFPDLRKLVWSFYYRYKYFPQIQKRICWSTFSPKYVQFNYFWQIQLQACKCACKQLNLIKISTAVWPISDWLCSVSPGDAKSTRTPSSVLDLCIPTLFFISPSLSFFLSLLLEGSSGD